METKTCRTCGETKPTSEYYRNSHTSDGYLGRCKGCQDSANKASRITPWGAFTQNFSNAIGRLRRTDPWLAEKLEKSGAILVELEPLCEELDSIAGEAENDFGVMGRLLEILQESGKLLQRILDLDDEITLWQRQQETLPVIL